MKRLLLAALALTSPIFVNPGMAAAPAEVAAAAGRWEAVQLPDEVEDAPLALAWSRSDPNIVYGRGRRPSGAARTAAAPGRRPGSWATRKASGGKHPLGVTWACPQTGVGP